MISSPHGFSPWAATVGLVFDRRHEGRYFPPTVRYLSVSHSIAFVSHGQWDEPQAYTVSPSSAGALNLIQNISFGFEGSWGGPIISALQLHVYLLFQSLKWTRTVCCECQYRHHSCHVEDQQPFKLKINLNSIRRSSPYRAVNTLRLGYTNQSVNVV